MRLRTSVFCQAFAWLLLAHIIDSYSRNRGIPRVVLVRWWKKITTTTPDPHIEALALHIGEVYSYGHSVARPELCPSRGSKLQLVILVASAIPNKRMRDGVRRSWGLYARQRRIAYAFVLGTIERLNNSMKREIRAESRVYKDIIIGTFDESHGYLVLKTLSMLEWVSNYCPKVPLVMKADDDVFINIPNLLAFISENRELGIDNTLYGQQCSVDMPDRNVSSKQFVPYMQYPKIYFPDYMSGAAYMMTADVAKRMLRVLPRMRIITREDALITGIVATRIGIRKDFQKTFLTRFNPYDEDISCSLMRSIAVHLAGKQDHFLVRRRIFDEVLSGRCF